MKVQHFTDVPAEEVEGVPGVDHVAFLALETSTGEGGWRAGGDAIAVAPHGLVHLVAVETEVVR